MDDSSQKSVSKTPILKDRKRKAPGSGLSRSRKISEPFVSPLLKRHDNLEKEPDNQICKKIKFDSSFNQHEAEAKTECSQTSTQDCTADDNILCSSPSSPTDMGMKELQLVLERKQETLRKLNMVKMYRKKNNLNELQDLITKWRKVSQEAATRLFDSITTEQKVTMSQLLNQLQITHELIRYSEDDEGFLSS